MALRSPRRSPFGVYVRSPLGVRAHGLGSGLIWMGGVSSIYEVSPIDFSAIRSDGTTDQAGLGGKEDVIWRCSLADKLEELDVDDFSVIRSAASPESAPTGIGGNSNVIWHCNTIIPPLLYELDVDDFSVVRSAANPGNSSASDIGGDGSKIWYTSLASAKNYELSTVDLSAVQNTSHSGGHAGIGGSADNIWHTQQLTNTISELSVADLSILRSDSGPGSTGDSLTVGGV